MYLRRERKMFKSGTRTYLSVAHNVVDKPAGKLARAKRKFQVYLKKKQGSDTDRWVN